MLSVTFKGLLSRTKRFLKCRISLIYCSLHKTILVSNDNYNNDSLFFEGMTTHYYIYKYLIIN